MILGLTIAAVSGTSQKTPCQNGFVTTRPRKVKMAPSLFTNGTSCFNNSVYHAYAYSTHVVVVYHAYAYRTRMVAVHFYEVQICFLLCPHN